MTDDPEVRSASLTDESAKWEDGMEKGVLRGLLRGVNVT